jgi:hypothetical protein
LRTISPRMEECDLGLHERTDDLSRRRGYVGIPAFERSLALVLTISCDRSYLLQLPSLPYSFTFPLLLRIH